MAIGKGPFRFHVDPFRHHVKSMLSYEVHRLPNEVDAHDGVGHWLDFEPDRMAGACASQGQRVADNFWEVATIDTKREAVGTPHEFIVLPRTRPLAILPDH